MYKNTHSVTFQPLVQYWKLCLTWRTAETKWTWWQLKDHDHKFLATHTHEILKVKYAEITTLPNHICVWSTARSLQTRDRNTLHKWQRRCWYLQTASSGKAQLLLKERNKGDYSGAHFQPKRWRSTALYVKLLFKGLTNRGHCDTTLWWAATCLLHELTHIKIKPIVLYCLKGFSHWPCMSLFGESVSSTSSHEGQRRVK